MIDRSSLEKISEIAADDLEARFRNKDYGAVDAEIKHLRDTGAAYKPQDGNLAEKMGVHEAYRGDRLREAFVEETQLSHMPPLDTLVRDTNMLEAVVSFTSRLPEADVKRFMDSVTAGYAVNQGLEPKDWQNSMTESAAQIAAAVEKMRLANT